MDAKNRKFLEKLSGLAREGRRPLSEFLRLSGQASEDDLKAVRATRLIRLERVDFEELVDDVPGLAASICRALGERARRAEEASYKSPLLSRA